LRFESVETLSRKVLGYIVAVVDDIGLDTDQAVAPPQRRHKKQLKMILCMGTMTRKSSQIR